LTLIPVYFFNSDARSYYFANLILGAISIILLFKISQKLTKSAWLTGLLLFTYVTSFVIYWQTSLAMAENVLLPVCFASLWLTLQPLNTKNLILSTLLRWLAMVANTYLCRSLEFSCFSQAGEFSQK
jgi:uncharacterized membrane protein YiaA